MPLDDKRKGKPDKPSRFGRLIKPNHASVCRDLGFTLTLGDDAAWLRFGIVLVARLTPAERARLAWSVLVTLTDRQIEGVAEAALVLAETEEDPVFGHAWREAVEEYRRVRR
jgi:hypothetical protein